MTSEDQQNLEKLLTNSKRRMYALQQQAALKGINTPPEVTIEIEDLEKTVEDLERKLAAITQSLDTAAAVPTPRQQRKRQLSQEQVNPLVELLLACPSISDRAARDNVVKQLPPAIVNSITRAPSSKVDVWAIVDTCRNYSGGIDALVEAVRFFDGGTIPMQAVDTFFQ